MLNARSGEFVERARITVEGTSLETFTDADGNYRLTSVPAGTAKLRIFYTGLLPPADDLGCFMAGCSELRSYRKGTEARRRCTNRYALASALSVFKCSAPVYFCDCSSA